MYIKSKEGAAKYLTDEVYFEKYGLKKRLNMFGMGGLIGFRADVRPSDKIVSDRRSPWWKNYRQEFGKDFSLQDVEEFARETFVKTGLFAKRPDDTVAVHVRNGDYVGSRYSNCYDRPAYLKSALGRFPECGVIKVFSDDIPLCKDLVEPLAHGRRVEYSGNSSDYEDFIELAGFRNKVLSNSTFSYWSAFVGNVIWPDSYGSVCAPAKFAAFAPRLSHVNPQWTCIDC